MLTLDIAIATLGADGIERTARMIPPPAQGVRYVVSWQRHGGKPLPEALRRDDVEVSRFDREGQSHNRNNAIEHCTGDIILHGDDDLTYYPDGLQAIREIFGRDEDVDLATFQSVQTPAKAYPAEAVDLRRRLPKNYSAITFEIAFRRATAGNLRCCPELGYNSPKLHGGEDEMFLMSAIRRGLRCRFYPVNICEHLHPSLSGRARLTSGNLRAMGCVIALTSPLTAALRVPLKAWRLSRAKQSGAVCALIQLSAGALMAPGVLRRNHDTLW